VPSQIRHPFAVAHLSLAPGPRLAMARGDQDDGEQALEQVEPRLPPYTPVLSLATCVPPTLLSPSPTCSSSSVIVAKGRISLRPLVIRHAPTVLACTAKPPHHSYPTSLASSCRSWRENRACQRVCSACSPLGWQHGMVPAHGSRVRLIDGLHAPRPLDLCLTRTGASVALGCLFFLWYGEVWPHHRLIGV
jgi:hypothetical protein